MKTYIFDMGQEAKKGQANVRFIQVRDLSKAVHPVSTHLRSRSSSENLVYARHVQLLVTPAKVFAIKDAWRPSDDIPPCPHPFT